VTPSRIRRALSPVRKYSAVNFLTLPAFGYALHVGDWQVIVATALLAAIGLIGLAGTAIAIRRNRLA